MALWRRDHAVSTIGLGHISKRSPWGEPSARRIDRSDFSVLQGFRREQFGWIQFPGRDSLFVRVAQECLEGVVVRIQSVWPEVLAENRLGALYPVEQSGEHVPQGGGLRKVLFGDFVGFDSRRTRPSRAVKLAGSRGV